MFKKVFFKNTNNDFSAKSRSQASTSYHLMTSTPNTSCANPCRCTHSVGTSPDISMIDKSTSAPIMVSDASVADLTRHFKKCSPSKSPLPEDSSNSSCSPKVSSSSSVCKKPCIKNAQVQTLPNLDKAQGVEELYFNDQVKQSGVSSPRVQINVEECPTKREGLLPPVCSSLLARIEKELIRSCGKMTKDSGGTCSLVDSNATCDASTRAQYYHTKLMSTLQILQNKEEMIRVQAESLSVAEARIACLTERADELRHELERKTKEYQMILKSLEGCKVEKSDACILTEQQMEDQSEIVRTLEDNLGVIQDLYRECFYETAKQDSLIDMLRSSYLDVRLMDKKKADQIGRLQTVINTQQWSLDRCQDIALEVDNLKTEISNFLHSSNSTNYDSGMWERSEESFASVPGVHDELHDIMQQLLRLQELLASGDSSCMCGLEDENVRLRRNIENIEMKISDLRGKICELECTLVDKDEAEQRNDELISAKEKELNNLRARLLAVEEGSRDQSSTCEAMTLQLRSTQLQLEEKNTELKKVQELFNEQMATVKQLREELEKADKIIEDNCKIRSEVSYLTKQVALWRAQLADSERRVRALEQELTRARAQAKHIDACYREKASNVAELQTHLEEAYARGAALCGETRHAVAGVRQWMRRMRDRHREQDNIIKKKDALITSLQQRLEERQSDSQRTSASDNACSKCMSSRDEHSLCSKAKRRVPSNSEVASCSSTPVPPPRLDRKKSCQNRHCKAWTCESNQMPSLHDTAADTSSPYCMRRETRDVRVTLDRAPRDVSPTELFLRVEQLSEALADGHRRWTRRHDRTLLNDKVPGKCQT